jgi:hypothetical protein
MSVDGRVPDVVGAIGGAPGMRGAPGLVGKVA